jgi:hypothetical protein
VSRRLHAPKRYASESGTIQLVDADGDNVPAEDFAVESFRILLRHFDVVWFQSTLREWAELTLDFLNDLVSGEKAR